MIEYIDTYRDRFGVEAICPTLRQTECGCITSRGYRAAKIRAPSARSLSDALLIPELVKVFEDNFSVYAVRKMWKAMQRAGWDIGRDQAARLMKLAGIQGRRRGRTPITTLRADVRIVVLIWSIVTSPRQRRTGCGSLTSPTCVPCRGLRTPRSSPMRTPARLSGLPPGRACAPMGYLLRLLSMLSTTQVISVLKDLSTTAIAARSTCPFVTVRRLPKLGLIRPLAPSAIPTTTRWRKRSKVCTRPS